jgi:hypothetical protein
MLTALFGLAIAFAGCVVTSIYPYYADQDVVFEPGLVGQWIGSDAGSDSHDTIQFKKGADQGYLLATTENNTLSDKYAAHLFQLGDQRFIDLYPAQRPNGDDLDFAAVHQVMKATVTATSLSLTGLNYKWLGELLEKDPRALRHVKVKSTKDGENKDEYRIVLTASTKELQDFIKKYMNTKEAWSDPNEFKRPAAKPAARSHAPESQTALRPRQIAALVSRAFGDDRSSPRADPTSALPVRDPSATSSLPVEKGV